MKNFLLLLVLLPFSVSDMTLSTVEPITLNNEAERTQAKKVLDETKKAAEDTVENLKKILEFSKDFWGSPIIYRLDTVNWFALLKKLGISDYEINKMSDFHKKLKEFYCKADTEMTDKKYADFATCPATKGPVSDDPITCQEEVFKKQKKTANERRMIECKGGKELQDLVQQEKECVEKKVAARKKAKDPLKKDCVEKNSSIGLGKICVPQKMHSGATAGSRPKAPTTKSSFLNFKASPLVSATMKILAKGMATGLNRMFSCADQIVRSH